MNISAKALYGYMLLFLPGKYLEMAIPSKWWSHACSTCLSCVYLPISALLIGGVVFYCGFNVHFPSCLSFFCHQVKMCLWVYTYVSTLVAQSCLTLCDPMNCGLPGSSVHGIFQARILEWVAISFSGDLPEPGIQPASPVSLALAGGFFTIRATREVVYSLVYSFPYGWEGEESARNAGDGSSNPRLGRFPWRRKWQPTPVFLLGEFHGQRSLAGHSSWGPKESDTTKQLTH